MSWAADGFYEQVEQTGLELTDESAPGARFIDCRLSSSLVTGVISKAARGVAAA